MMWTYMIHGETPPQKNMTKFNFRTGRTYKDKRFAEWRNKALAELMASPKPGSPISKPCSVSVTFYHGDFRRRDSDNQLSAIMDLLVKAEILADDDWKIARVLNVANQYSKDAPKATIVVEIGGE